MNNGLIILRTISN